jgi:signal transduction histidine kinase
MRFLASVAAVLMLLILLTGLLMLGIRTDEPRYTLALHALDDYSLAEATLHHDVLQARTGLLRNYDPINKSFEAMRDAVARLRNHAQSEGLDEAPVNHLAAKVAEQETEAERFKTDNALLQNSLSYFGLLSASPDFINPETHLAPAIGALAAAVLHLTLDSSPESAQAVQQCLDQLTAQAPSTGPRAAAAQSLVAHARLLERLLPDIDQYLKTLVAGSSNEPLKAIRDQFSERHAAVETTARRFRLLLYAVSLLLLVTLVRLGMQLRARALALRRRAAFEHVIAQNSTRLINCPPTETESRLKQVLGEFGRAIGADRAYVVLDERPIRVYAWSASEAPYPSGWPDEALKLSGQLSKVGLDIVAVPNIAELPPSEARNKLAAFGVGSFGCVSLIWSGRVWGIIGFDKFQPARSILIPLPVARLAGDVVASAIERDALERDRARLTLRLERARRMETVGQFASGIAHNFNNIIAAILGYSEMLEGELMGGTKASRQVSEIRSAAERGRDLIDNILTFGRRRVARSRPVLVRGLLDETASLLRASLAPDIELAIDEVPPHIAVLVDPVHLQQIILNLCHNASQAMKGKGRIKVTVDERKVTSPLALSHGELETGSYVRLAICDTGPGIDASVARRLFEPFFTTRPDGTGLGLATVREIILDHEGTINVVSTPGAGTRFEAWLPAADGNAATEQDGEMPLPLGRGETVLILEQEQERLLGDEETLAALGYEPVGFQDVADAVVTCRAEPARFDAILISEASATIGCQLAQALHEVAARRPILLATTSAIDVHLDALAQAGISELLRRPLVGTELAAALARCLRSQVLLRM